MAKILALWQRCEHVFGEVKPLRDGAALELFADFAIKLRDFHLELCEALGREEVFYRQVTVPTKMPTLFCVRERGEQGQTKVEEQVRHHKTRDVQAQTIEQAIANDRIGLE